MSTGPIALTGRAGPSTVHLSRNSYDAVLVLALLDCNGRACAEVERHYRGAGAETFARNDQRALVIGTVLSVHASTWRVDTVPAPRLVLGGQVHWQAAAGSNGAPPLATLPGASAPAGHTAAPPASVLPLQPAPRRRLHEAAHNATTTAAAI